MTSETYTSKDGRVTVREDRYTEQHWIVAVRTADSCSVDKALFPDPQLLADQVAEQQPKPRYYVEETTYFVVVRDATLDRLAPVSDFRKATYPDARERAEQAAAELNSRCTVASDGNARAAER